MGEVGVWDAEYAHPETLNGTCIAKGTYQASTKRTLFKAERLQLLVPEAQKEEHAG